MITNADAVRKEKGTRIANTENCVYRVDDTKYKVVSQSGNGYYDIEETDIGWKCNCPDHKHRGMKCKHIWAVVVSLGIRQQAKPKIVLEPITINGCPVCDSQSIKKDGIRHNKSGDLQRYQCIECGKKFSINVGFEKMKHNPKAVTSAMQLVFLR